MRLSLQMLQLTVVLAAAGLPLGCRQKAEPEPAPRNPPSAAATSNAPAVARPVQAQVQSPGAAPSLRPGAIRLPHYELQMDPAHLRALEGDPGSNQTYPGTLVADGQSYDGVQVRFRGEWARSWPKKPFKIFFSRDQPFQGHHSVNLNSAWRDASVIRETLAYHVYAACGVPAPSSQIVRLDLNGKFRGLYVEVEQIDKTLMKRFGLKGAVLFKSTSDENEADERDHRTEAMFARHYENETEKGGSLGELQAFCHELAVTTNALAFFEQRLDIPEYINYLAATALVQHWDGFNKNHFLVYDRKGSGQWQVWPWDLDRTLGDHWNQSFDWTDLPLLLGTRGYPSVTGWNRLQDRFLRVPELRARFYKRLGELLETEFTPGKLHPLLDELETVLKADAALDKRRWRGPGGDLHSGIAVVKRFIERRRAFLLGELGRVR